MSSQNKKLHDLIKMMKQQKAFVSILFMQICFITSLLSLLWAVYHHTQKNFLYIQEQCHLQSLKVQTQLMLGIESVLNLNPMAQVLQKQEKLAKRALALSAPSNKAAALFALQIIHKKQDALNLFRKNIILQSKAKAYNLERKIQNNLEEQHSNQIEMKKSPYYLAIEYTKSDLNTRSPRYSLKNNFKELQEWFLIYHFPAEVLWQNHFLKKMSHQISSEQKMEWKKKISIQCNSSAYCFENKKGAYKCLARMTADKA